MKKLILSLLLSTYAYNAMAEDVRDVSDWMAQQNPTTADNPNEFVTGNLACNSTPIAQINFNVDPETEFGKKFLDLLAIYKGILESADEAAAKEASQRFEKLTEKEQQFLQVLAAFSVQLHTAAQELFTEYTAQQ